MKRRYGIAIAIVASVVIALYPYILVNVIISQYVSQYAKESNNGQGGSGQNGQGGQTQSPQLVDLIVSLDQGSNCLRIYNPTDFLVQNITVVFSAIIDGNPVQQMIPIGRIIQPRATLEVSFQEMGFTHEQPQNIQITHLEAYGYTIA